MKNINKAIKLKSDLDSLRPLSEEDESRIMQKFRLDWNYHSNHIEGNSLTYGETKALIMFGITAQGKPLKDHFEIAGHDEAIKWILEIIKQDRPLTESFIRELHTLVLKEPYEKEAITSDGTPTTKRIEVGQYKTLPNHVQTVTGEIFRFATPEETPAKMGDLLEWYRTQTDKEDFNPVLVASEFHYKFIRIHPFDDGNGRTARILMNFILLQNAFPPIVIKTEDKANYLSVLRQADAGLLEPFVEYIADNLVHSLELMIKGAKGESVEDPDDLDKELSLLEQKLNDVSQNLEIVKNKDSILDVFDKSIMPLTMTFIEKAEKFEKFYLKNKFNIVMGPAPFSFSEKFEVDKIKIHVDEHINSFKIKFSYKNFRQIGFEGCNYSSSIEFHFSYTTYSIFNSDKKVFFEKPYSEQLEEDEIIELVNCEMKKHKDYIEKKILEIGKSK